MAAASACPDCGYTGEATGPGDLAVALRSLPRRFRELVEHLDEELGADGQPSRRDEAVTSTLRRAGVAAEGVREAGENLRRVLVLDRPSIPASQALGDPASGAALSKDPIGDLAATTAEAAELVERTHGEAWTRTGMRDGMALSALDLGREVVHAGIHHLHAAEAAAQAALRLR